MDPYRIPIGLLLWIQHSPDIHTYLYYDEEDSGAFEMSQMANELDNMNGECNICYHITFVKKCGANNNCEVKICNDCFDKLENFISAIWLGWTLLIIVVWCSV